MCGISVWISKKPILEEKFKIFNDSVSHRGPDYSDLKFYSKKDLYIALGHRRLSIIDLSKNANQPMTYGGLSIVFNGEIYNYIEIKNELIKNKFSFHTNSDTEVLIAAYLFWGKECLHKFNGMFSFIIYDEKNNEVFFARDRFGVKPLYYYNLNNEAFYFASEIKQFTYLDGFLPKGNINTIGNFIDHRYFDYSSETFFKNIYQIQAGEAGFLDLKDLKLNKFTWYDLGNTKINRSVSFKELFVNSVNLRLRSDVEVGSCLSGGIDSTSIVSVADYELSKIKKLYTLKTFTSCFDNEKYDERSMVEITKNKTKIKSFYVFPKGDDFFKDLKDLIYFQDEPIWSSSIYAGSCIFKEAQRKGVKVMLDGQGADEVFCGYSGVFYPTYLKSRSLIENIIELLISKNKRSVLKVLFEKFFKIKKTKKIFTLLKKKYDSKFKDEFHSLKEHVLYFMQFHLPALLHYEDRNSMRYSIEARLPFLDFKLVETGFHTFEEKKISKGVGKKIIRDSLRGITSDEILDNNIKKGFVTPQREWMITNKKEIIKNIKFLEKFNIFDDNNLNFIIQKFDEEVFDEGQIMRLYTLSIWTNIFKIKKVI